MSNAEVGSVWHHVGQNMDILVTGFDEDMVYFEFQHKNGEFDTGFHALSSFDKHHDFIRAAQKPKHSHYHKDVSQYDTIDIYVICDLYVKDNSGCIQHAVKKLLCCGERGVKSNVKDLQEAIDTIQRKIEMLQCQGEVNDD